MSVLSADFSQRVAELRFCIEELHRRQHTDHRRAWLWQLKENAARQALVMLRAKVDDDPMELSVRERREVMAVHSLLKDPHVLQNPNRPAWRRELQAHARRALEQHLEQIQRRHAQAAHIPEE